MWIRRVLISFLLWFNISLSNALQEVVLQRVQELGYRLERHKLVTEDGYVLTLYRIPGSKTGGVTKPFPVLLFHGFLFSMNQWLVLPSESAAFELADAGYDVWLANARGTSYSREHVKLTDNDSEYWNFEWHEIGLYDVPAMIDYVLIQTRKPKVHYVCHSQGCTVLLVALSMKPENKQKLTTTYFLAPALFLQNTTGLANLLPVGSILSSMNLAVIPSMSAFAPCKNLAMAPVCIRMLASIFGPFTSTLLGLKSSVLMAKHVIDYGSTKQLMHFEQLMDSGRFQLFDYGAKNFEFYGSSDPPLYDLSGIDIPITIRGCYSDSLVPGAAIRNLISKLQYVHSYGLFPGNHIEFLFSSDINSQVNRDMISTLESHYRNNEGVTPPIGSFPIRSFNYRQNFTPSFFQTEAVPNFPQNSVYPVFDSNHNSEISQIQNAIFSPFASSFPLNRTGYQYFPSRYPPAFKYPQTAVQFPDNQQVATFQPVPSNQFPSGLTSQYPIRNSFFPRVPIRPYDQQGLLDDPAQMYLQNFIQNVLGPNPSFSSTNDQSPGFLDYLSQSKLPQRFMENVIEQLTPVFSNQNTLPGHRRRQKKLIRGALKLTRHGMPLVTTFIRSMMGIRGPGLF